MTQTYGPRLNRPRRPRKRVVAVLAASTAFVVCLTTAVIAGVVAVSSVRAEAPGGSAKPNIVFVLVDDMDSGLLKYMPQVQQLQKDGTNFSNYSVTNSLCCPSRASILTGKYPHNTKILTNMAPDGGFKAFRDRGLEKQSVAVRLQQAGYQTGFMGKYLNGYEPKKLIENGKSYVPPGWNEWDVAGGDGYPQFNYTLNENGKLVPYGKKPTDYLGDVIAGKGDAFIRKSAQAGKPFMLELSTFAPHGPFTPAPRHKNEFPGLKAPRDPSFNEADVSDKANWLRSKAKLTEREITKIDQDYRKRVQSLQAVDEMIGRLRATLTATGQADNTHIVFSSDNGFHLGQHRLRSGKTTAFNTDVNVPMVVAGPGVKPGAQTSQTAENIDLFSTFTELAGASSAGTDGTSLVPLLRGQSSDRKTTGLVEHQSINRNKSDPDYQSIKNGDAPTYTAIRTATTTYVEYLNGEREYYDRKRDPYELTNSYSSVPPAQRATLHKQLEALRTCAGTTECQAAGGG